MEAANITTYSTSIAPSSATATSSGVLCATACLGVEGGTDDLLRVDAGALELLGDRALPHHQDAVAQMGDLLGVARVEHHRPPLAGQVEDEVVDVVLGGHVDAARDV